MITLDNLIIEVACPECGGTIRQSVNWFKRSGPHCSRGCQVWFDNTAFKALITQAEFGVQGAIASLRPAGAQPTADAA